MSHLADLSPINYILIAGIVWLSGVFIWLIKKFVSSFEKNTVVMTKVQGTLEGVDRKLDSAADRDLEIVKTLSAIHARTGPARVEIVHQNDKKQ